MLQPKKIVIKTRQGNSDIKEKMKKFNNITDNDIIEMIDRSNSVDDLKPIIKALVLNTRRK